MNTKLHRSILLAAITFGSFTLKAQTVATFENLTLETGNYWNGSSIPLGTTFTSGDAIFPNYYDTAFGGYWSSGWAYSNIVDSSTAGYLYSARPAIGYAGSANYIIGQQGSVINLDSVAIGNVVNGFYVTNTTYAAISMRDGDDFARKFGDTTGTGSDSIEQGTYPDWFKLTIKGYRSGSIIEDSVNFYLADYRFTDSASDYIVTDWRWVDLTSLGNVDSLTFSLSSSDNGSFGMNTPAFFAIDNFTTDSVLTTNVTSVNKPSASFNVFPNPCKNELTIGFANLKETEVTVSVKDVTGKLIYSAIQSTSTNLYLNSTNFENGIYFINVIGENINMNQKFIKQ